MMEKVITSQNEKIAYGLGDIGSCIMWAFMGSFITFYYTKRSDWPGHTNGDWHRILASADSFSCEPFHCVGLEN